MRRKDREKDADFALAVVDKAEYAVISMVDTDGMPYSTAVSHARKDNVIYFHCATEGKRTDILRINPKVCVSCITDVEAATDKFTTAFSSAIIFGAAFEVTDLNEKIEALRCICTKLTPSNLADFDNAIERSIGRTAVWKISIDEITGKQKVLK